MSENESIEQAIRRAERSSGGDITAMIAAGIEAGLATRDVPGTIHYLMPLKFRIADMPCATDCDHPWHQPSLLQHKADSDASSNFKIRITESMTRATGLPELAAGAVLAAGLRAAGFEIIE